MKLNKVINIIISILLIISINNYSLAKYVNAYNGYASGVLATAVFEVFTQDQIVQELTDDDNDVEYYFRVINTYDNKTSDVDFYYTIEIINSNENFPADIELFDNNDNLIMLEDGVSSVQELDGVNESENIYYIRVTKTEENIDSQTQIGIRINAWQKI